MLTDLILTEGHERSRVLGLVAAVEARSEHPLARAIAQAAEQESVTVPKIRDFSAQAGLGVEASVNGTAVRIGSAEYMSRSGVDIEPVAADAMALSSVFVLANALRLRRFQPVPDA